MNVTTLPAGGGLLSWRAAGRTPRPGVRHAVLGHAGVAFALLALYGGAVCPFIESLPVPALLLPLALVFVALPTSRGPLARRLPAPVASDRNEGCFLLDLGLYVVAGVLVAGWNGLFHGFPGASGVKVLIGFGVVGFFVACDLSLRAELAASRRMMARGESVAEGGRMHSFVRRSTVFGLFAVLALALIVLLVVRKDLLWLGDNLHTGDFPGLQRSVMVEIAFVTLVIGGYVLRVIVSFARNLRFYCEQQALALTGAAAGRFVACAPATTHDELGRIAALTNRMITQLGERTRELEVTQEVTILCLASLAETRDNETGAHLLRTQRYVRTLAESLRDHPRFRDELDDRAIDLMCKSAPLHDVGKVGIPDRILLKPGKLTPEEFEIMKTHARLGAEALAVAETQLGASSFMRHAREIAAGHHEKWDGSGYPLGLAGEEIPISARLMALADVYDALRSERVYKPAFGHGKSRDIIVAGRGAQFDPAVVDAFLAEEATFERVAAELAD